MRKLIFLILFFPFSFFAQKNIIVEYGEIWSKSIMNAFLYIDNDKSLYIELANPKVSPTSEEVFSKDFDIEKIGYLILKENDRFFLTDVIPKLKKTMTVDKAPVIQWKILSENKKILEYNCKKAEANFRGRKVFAYFTSEIPSTAGPWKYSGLPRLILEAWDEEERYHYVPKKIIQNTKLEIPIKIQEYIVNLKSKPIPFKKFIEIENEFKIKTHEMIMASLPTNSFTETDFVRENSKELLFE